MAEIKLPEVELNIYTPKDTFEATIVENYICSRETSPNIIRHITFDISGSNLVGRIGVGQSIGVLPPGINEKGRPNKIRLYSISSPAGGEGGNPNHISTTVKRVIEEIDGSLFTGLCSNYICDLKPGDKILLTGPSGKRFLLPENKNDFNYVFFATGTGIAPFRAMIIELLENGFNGQIALVFGSPYRTDLLYPDYFKKMEKEHRNFHYLSLISREDRRPDGSKYYVQTAIEDRKEILSPILEQDDTLIYLCGLKGMENGIYYNLALQGFTDYLILQDVLATTDAKDWKWDDVKKFIKPSARTFEEVY